MEKAHKRPLLSVVGVIALLVIAYFSRALHTQVDEPALKMLLVHKLQVQVGHPHEKNCL